MSAAAVCRNETFAGTWIEEKRHQFVFSYDDNYLIVRSKPAISLTLSKTKEEDKSEFLFPQNELK